MKEPRRNPKRKASEAAPDGSERNADDLLRKACGSLTAQDIGEWQGWGEVESEPVWIKTLILQAWYIRDATTFLSSIRYEGEQTSKQAFFNAIIRDLGVERVQVQELFTMDQTSLDAVSKPVFGLVFLFQYGPAEEEEEQPHESNTQLWFANQARSLPRFLADRLGL
ncbi:hypothetical protein E4U56_008412 [Claviceps arundinis]|uniref:ubiquitinyl hydrolase 1 n=1 Tax=Claviceps arundinis TaxID=1623583 RepID=A0A9P7MSJ0_9HYPO|nr:hypothetical protein E4U56_008412 [Claviceps arundinis]